MTWHQFRATKGEPLGFLCMVNAARDKPQLPTADDLARLKADPKIAAFLEFEGLGVRALLAGCGARGFLAGCGTGELLGLRQPLGATRRLEPGFGALLRRLLLAAEAAAAMSA